MTKKEKLIDQIMRECEADGEPVTKEEAEAMAEMELHAKDVKHRGDNATRKEPAVRVRKIDTVKKEILEAVRILIEAMQINVGEPADTDVKTETELLFSYKGDLYTIKLTKHRKKGGE